MTTKREPYYATTLFENNAPNTAVVLKRATPGAKRFNGEVIARCVDDATARQLAAALNLGPIGALAPELTRVLIALLNNPSPENAARARAIIKEVDATKYFSYAEGR